MTKTRNIQKNKRSGSHNSKSVIYDGITYPSLEQMAKALKTSPQLIRYYLKRDAPFGGLYIDYAI